MFTVKQLIAALEGLPESAGVAIRVDDLNGPNGLYGLDEGNAIDEEGPMVILSISGADEIEEK